MESVWGLRLENVKACELELEYWAQTTIGGIKVEWFEVQNRYKSEAVVRVSKNDLQIQLNENYNAQESHWSQVHSWKHLKSLQ